MGVRMGIREKGVMETSLKEVGWVLSDVARALLTSS